MPTETESPVKRTHPIVLANLEAEERASLPATPWQPAPLRPPPHPAVVALREKAEGVRDAAAAELERADGMTTAANVVGQRIASLEREKTGLANRLANVEATDFKAQRESARQTIHQFYGTLALTVPQRESLNMATFCLAWSPLLEKEIPLIKKDLQNRLEKIETELASLTK